MDRSSSEILSPACEHACRNHVGLPRQLEIFLYLVFRSFVEDERGFPGKSVACSRFFAVLRLYRSDNVQLHKGKLAFNEFHVLLNHIPVIRRILSAQAQRHIPKGSELHSESTGSASFDQGSSRIKPCTNGNLCKLRDSPLIK